MNEFKFSCSHCGQHLLADDSAVGVTISCPNCQEEIQVPGHSFNMPPASVAPFRVVKPVPVKAGGITWGQVLVLILLGYFAPGLVMVAGILTVALGPLALVAFPLVVGYGSFQFAGLCLKAAPRKLFWIYPATTGAGLVIACVISLLVKGHVQGGAPDLGGALGATYGGIGLILAVPLVSIPWGVGMVAALRKS